MAFNLPAGFKTSVDSGSVTSKLERSSKSTSDHFYSISPQGVELTKGEEIGFFRMGSTVAVVFECSPDIKMRREVGEKVLMGEKLYD